MLYTSLTQWHFFFCVRQRFSHWCGRSRLWVNITVLQETRDWISWRTLNCTPVLFPSQTESNISSGFILLYLPRFGLSNISNCQLYIKIKTKNENQSVSASATWTRDVKDNEFFPLPGMIWFHDGMLTGSSLIYEGQDINSITLLKLQPWHFSVESKKN